MISGWGDYQSKGVGLSPQNLFMSAKDVLFFEHIGTAGLTY